MSFYHSSRAGWFQRGGGPGDRGNRGNRGGASFRTEAPVSAEPLGPKIDSIDIKTVLIEDEAPVIANVEYVASYNWLHGSTILVPGQSFHPQRKSS